jgi:peptidoglycan/LPS O-acetylase OafA/YrhL
MKEKSIMGAIGFRQIPSLNGIRAAAASLVFLSHAYPAAGVPSSLGVTVFFFLSGYLITTLLRREFGASGGISFRGFYLRRACRIFPPMFFMLLLAIAVTLQLHGSESLHASAIAAQFLHFSNYALIAHDSDWLVPYTSVMWSLAVEEHFYLAFPLLFLCLARRGSMRSLARWLFCLCIAALAWRVLLVTQFHVSEPHIYYSTDTRFDSLLFGCILGVWRNPELDFAPADRAAPDAREKLLFAASLLLLLAASAWRNPLFQLTLRYTLQGIALMPLFWLMVRYPRWLPFAWLNWKSVSWLGVISYTFYLSHPLWLHLAGSLAPGHAGVILGYGLTLLFSAALYYTLERPFLALAHGRAARMRPVAMEKAMKESA